MNGVRLVIPKADFSANGMPSNFTAVVKVAESSSSMLIKMIDSGNWNFNNINETAYEKTQSGGTERSVSAAQKDVETFVKWNSESTGISFDTNDGAQLSYLKLYRSSKDALTSLDNLMVNQKVCSVIDLTEFNGEGITSLRGAFAQAVSGDNRRKIIGLETLIAPYTELKARCMFQFAKLDASCLDIDLSAWKAIVVDGLGSTFFFATNINSLNISGWDLSRVRNAYQGFGNISNLYLNGTKIYTGTYSYIVRPFANIDCVYVDGVTNQNNNSTEAKTWIKDQLDSRWSGSYIAQPQDSNGNVVEIANAYKLVKTAVE
jgi:surface protein